MLLANKFAPTPDFQITVLNSYDSDTSIETSVKRLFLQLLFLSTIQQNSSRQQQLPTQ